MSRTTNRAPRKDIALLRRLKDPNFSPSSLLQEGSNILQRADQLKGFVAQQRGKLNASANKTEWLLAYQQLQAEQEDAERELTTFLQQLAEQHAADIPEVHLASSQLTSQAEACRSERLKLRMQVKGLATVHGSLKAYGTPSTFSDEARAVKAQMASLREDLALALEQLVNEAAEVASSLRDAWPSALPTQGGVWLGGGDEGDAAGASGFPSVQAARTDDVEELERMMARYPLASTDIKDRIREVFAALQEKYKERLETWRLEAEQAAAGLAAGFSSAAVAGSLAPRSGLPRLPPGADAAARAANAGARHLQPLVAPKRAVPLPARAAPTRTASTGSEGSRPASSEGGGAVASGSRASETGAGGASWLLSGYGGWAADEHSAFVRHRDRMMKDAGQCKQGGREAVMARIAVLLPGRSAAEALAHDDWCTAARLLARKRRDLDQAWERERRQFCEDSGAFLQESETLIVAQAEEAADRLVAELLRERARDELEELRADRAHEEEVAAAERAAREAEEAAARLKEDARERAERAVKKELIAAYRAEMERQQAEEAEAAAEAEREAAALAEAQAGYNRERVEWRHAEYLVRLEQAKERQEDEAAEAAARAARLERLRALVAPEVAPDPERLAGHTAASAAAAAAVAAERAAAERGEGGAFHAVNGYTNEQVYKDQRFKVLEALRKHGLHDTDYGRQVINAARPAHATRPDNFTSEQRAGMAGGSGRG